MEKFRTVLDFFLNHQKALGYGAVSLLTVGSEGIFSVVVFKCPCNSWNKLYGLVFLLVPALILCLLGLLLSSRFWKVITGCCSPHRINKSCTRRRCRHYSEVLCQVIVGAGVAPFTWIAVALLGSSFYECAATGIPALQENLCQGKGNSCSTLLLQVPCRITALPKEMHDMPMVLQAQSQVAGWILITILFILVVISTCISRCRSPVSILHLAFWKMYVEKEKELFKAKAKEHAAQLAERNLKCFFASTEPEEFQTPSAKAWHGISSTFAFNPEKDYYSMIHKYVSTKTSSGSIQSVQGDTFPCCMGFVDHAGGLEEQV